MTVAIDLLTHGRLLSFHLPVPAGISLVVCVTHHSFVGTFHFLPPTILFLLWLGHFGTRSSSVLGGWSHFHFGWACFPRTFYTRASYSW